MFVYAFFSVILFVININVGKPDGLSLINRIETDQRRTAVTKTRLHSIIELRISRQYNWDKWQIVPESDIYLISKAMHCMCITLHFHHFRSTINLKTGQTDFFFLFLSFPHHHSVLLPRIRCSVAVAANLFRYLFKLAEAKANENRKKKSPIQFVYSMQRLHH